MFIEERMDSQRSAAEYQPKRLPVFGGQWNLGLRNRGFLPRRTRFEQTRLDPHYDPLRTCSTFVDYCKKNVST